MSFYSGISNSLSDVGGLKIGHASSSSLKSGVTVVIADNPAVAAVSVLGGAPGTRETDLLEPHNLVETVDAIVLSGGSAFGLDAASGVQAWLQENGRGFEVGPYRIPIVPSAILFDLINGGDKAWGRYSPYRELGFTAAAAAVQNTGIGSIGAGTGALTANIKGGLGTASATAGKFTIGALVAVNAIGSATIGDGPHFWAGAFEQGAEFGGLGLPSGKQSPGLPIKFRDLEGKEKSNTTIAIIATDAVLTKAQAKRLAISAHDGFARALWPAHTAFDGDTVFALSTGLSGVVPEVSDFIDLCAAASATMARAIARGVYSATKSDHDIMPVWSERFA
ncbi:MAG: P1 family peptidase [Notoacmeibacter sp.]